MLPQEIICRAKRLDSGEWAEGYFVKTNRPNTPAAYILPLFPTVPNVLRDDAGGVSINRFIQVDPATVCLYSGKKDKNGTKIFDGAIVKGKKDGTQHIGKIVFVPRNACFEFWYDWVVGAHGEKATARCHLSYQQDIEVLGNLWDNPELLETPSRPEPW